MQQACYNLAMLRRVVLAVLFATALLRAQDPAWALPLRGAAEYERQFTATSVIADSRAAVLQAEAKVAPPAGLLPRLAMAPWLCQGELTADQRAIGDEPRDLRDVLRAVACDLRLRGASRLRYLRIVPFGDLEFSGTVEPLSATGEQRFTLQVATGEPEVRLGETKAALRQFVRPLCTHDATGSLEVSRTFDATAGVVRSFRAELTLVYAESKQRFRKLVVCDEWTLVAVHDNQDAAFRGSVAAAIRSGAQWLARELGNSARNYWKDQADAQRSYGGGRLALALLTLLHAEWKADDPLIVAGFKELARRELVDTYSLGVALMAMAERYAPPGESERLRSGVATAPKPRQLSVADKALASAWLARLQKNLDTRVDGGYRLRFNYVAGPRFDNSVNQYGLLGLYAALLCEIEVPASTWRAAATHLLEVQGDPNGRDVRLSLTSYREIAAAVVNGGKGTRVGNALVAARGYAYQGPERPSYGSMTTAGITGLVIARAGLVRAGLGKADLMPKIDAAIQSGFGWLAAEFSVRSNPGYIASADDNWYYYLYGLERTCELAGVAHVQDRDWYYEGALQLMPHQGRNGAFATEHARGLALDATCFAVLFLKKASLPAVTGG